VRHTRARECHCPRCFTLRELDDVGCLGAFLSANDFEFNLIAFLQGLVPLTGNGSEVDEYVWPTFAPEETISLCVVEPANIPLNAFHLLSLTFLTRPKSRLRLIGFRHNRNATIGGKGGDAPRCAIGCKNAKILIYRRPRNPSWGW